MAHKSTYIPLPSLPEDMESQQPMLAGAEEYQWEAVPNLDLFFARLYRYWAGKGLTTQVLSGALNLAALGFTVAFSGFLLLGVNWHALLTAPCIAQDTCDIASVALVSHPLASRGVAADALLLAYLVIFGAYWAWTALHYVSDIRDMMEMRHWVCNKLGVSDRGITLMTWAEVLHKVVRLQASSRLCMARDLNEHDIVSRIMRKDNYMIALVNKGVLRLTPPPLTLVAGRAGCGLARAAARGTGWMAHQLSHAASRFDSGAAQAAAGALERVGAGLDAWADGNRTRVAGRWSLRSGRPSSRTRSLLGGRRALMTKTLEWNLRWCVLDHMFDDKFCVRREFLEQPDKLKQRLRRAAIVNAVLSPFLLLFLLLYFFLRNAERFYHHPGSAGSRRWTALARWHLREFNELPHYIAHRLDAAHAHACHYLAQFPSHTIASIARFVAFVAGSFTALFLLLTMLDERLLERPLLGRQLVWWLASLGVVLTASRSFINDAPVAYDPEAAMQQVVVYTHYLPRNWRGRAHTAEVQAAFNQLFQFKVLLFLEELASVVLTPFMLYFTLPQCADDIVRFVSDFTVHVEGVGDVCSLACFDLQAHGNPKYGAPCLPGGPVRKEARSRQGKLEKSLLTFMATYPTWEPGPQGKAMLMSLYQQQNHLHHPLHSLTPSPAAAAAVWASSGGQHHGFDPAAGMADCYGAPVGATHNMQQQQQQQRRQQQQAAGEKWQGMGAGNGAQAVLNAAHTLSQQHSSMQQQPSQCHEQQEQQQQQQAQHYLWPGGSELFGSGMQDVGGGAAQCGGSLKEHQAYPSQQQAVGNGHSPEHHDTGVAAPTGIEQQQHEEQQQQQQPEVQAQGQNEQTPTSPAEPAATGVGASSAWAPLATSLQCSVFGVLPLQGASMLAADDALAHETHQDVLLQPGAPGSEAPNSALLLPPNETEELSRRLITGHSVLQGLYEQSDASVQHRRMARYGSAAAGSMSGMNSSSMWGTVGWGYPQALHSRMSVPASHVSSAHGSSMQQPMPAYGAAIAGVHHLEQGAGTWSARQAGMTGGQAWPGIRGPPVQRHHQQQQQYTHAGMLHHHQHHAAAPGGGYSGGGYAGGGGLGSLGPADPWDF